MREDKSLLVITHLSQLLTYITGIGGLIVPLIIWAFKKDEVFAFLCPTRSQAPALLRS